VGSGVVGPSSTPQSGWYLLGRDTCRTAGIISDYVV
jgi:hypothetical protein